MGQFPLQLGPWWPLELCSISSHATSMLVMLFTLPSILGLTLGSSAPLITPGDLSSSRFPFFSFFFPFLFSLQFFCPRIPPSLRRGFEVYQTVCSSCHSLKRIAYRNLIGVTHTEEETKALAEAVDVTDGPDDQGEYFKRPGKVWIVESS